MPCIYQMEPEIFIRFTYNVNIGEKNFCSYDIGEVCGFLQIGPSKLTCSVLLCCYYIFNSCYLLDS